MMKPIILISLAILVLAACAPTTGAPAYNPNSSALYGTAGAVAAQETAVAGQLTSTASAVVAQATGTAVSATQQAQAAASATAEVVAAQTTGTSESLAFRATEQALNVEATYSAIAANATATDVALQALFVERGAVDEAARLANERQQEQMWSAAKMTVFVLLGLGGAFLLVMAGWRFYNLSRPIKMDDGQFILPANQYQIMPARPLALPAPEDTEINPEPIQLPRLEKGHVMIVGVTGDGKSMALREIIDHRQNVTVLDPHYTPGAWGQARAIGGGRDFEAIKDFMNWMQDELNRRAQARAVDGQRQFEELTVATEEMPAIISASDRAVRKMWMEWMREGRKFGLFMVVVSQSTRVETMGIKGEGDLLNNFNYVIELASSASQNYPDLVAGMERPAILRSRNRVQPVIIPYDPRRDPESPLFLTAGNQMHQPPQEIIEIEGVPVSPAMIHQIVTMRRAGESQRAIENEVFGYMGGQAHTIVKQILDEYVDAVNGRFPAIQ